MKISPIHLGLFRPNSEKVLRGRAVKIKIAMRKLKLSSGLSINPSYRFLSTNISLLSLKVETKEFSVHVEKLDLEGAVISKWKPPSERYRLHDILSRELYWMTGYISKEAGISEEEAINFLKTLLGNLSDISKLSESYIASLLRKLNLNLDPKKILRLAREIKLFLENLIGIIRFHGKAGGYKDHIEFLMLTLKRMEIEKTGKNS